MPRRIVIFVGVISGIPQDGRIAAGCPARGRTWAIGAPQLLRLETHGGALSAEIKAGDAADAKAGRAPPL